MHKSKTSIWGQYLLHKLASKKLIVNNIQMKLPLSCSLRKKFLDPFDIEGVL